MAKSSLNEIVNAWAAWKSDAFNGGGVKFVATTNYSDFSELGDYMNHQVTPGKQTIDYDMQNASIIPAPPVQSTSILLTNGSNTEQSLTYSDSQTTTQTYSWSVTEAASVSIEISSEVSVPDVAKIGDKVSTTLSVSNTTGSTISEEHTWTVNDPVNVAANSSVKAQMVIDIQQYNINWNGKCILNGQAAVWFNNKIVLEGAGNNLHYLWFPALSQILKDITDNQGTPHFSGLDTSGFIIDGQVLAPWSYPPVIALSSGVFTGSQGIDLHVSYN